jgi:methionine transaminase
MHPPIDSKLPRVGTTIFTVMSRLAAEHGAINLSQGFPDFEPPARLTELADHHMRQRAGAGNQYAPMTGLPSLREAIAAKIAEYYGCQASPDSDITVASGGTEALFCAIQAIVRAGDEVILLDPAYDSYEPAVELAGGRAVHVPLRRPGFGIDWQRLADAITPRTRLLIVNFPHNPSGATLESADLAQLAELLRGTGIFVLSDEVYEHMLFDGRRHQSLLRHAELAARSFVVSSFGKTYHATPGSSARSTSSCSSWWRRHCRPPSPTSCANAPRTRWSCPRSTRRSAITSRACSQRRVSASSPRTARTSSSSITRP